MFYTTELFHSFKNSYFMQLIFVLFFTFFASPSCSYVESSNVEVSTANPSFTKSFQVSADAAMTLKTSGASIKSSARQGNEIVVEFYVKKNGKVIDMTLDELRKTKNVTIEENANEVIVKIENKGGYSKMSVALVAYAPVRTANNLLTSGGSIQLNGFEGNHSLKTSGGSISFKDVSGIVNAGTSGGSIKADDIKGKVDASTSGGSISLRDVEGRMVVKTSGGSINLNDINGSVSGRTSGGSIKADFSSINGEIELQTTGGSIMVDVPDNAGVDVELSGNSVSLDLEQFEGNKQRSKAHGAINGGGHKISCKTVGGSVKVF